MFCFPPCEEVAHGYPQALTIAIKRALPKLCFKMRYNILKPSKLFLTSFWYDNPNIIIIVDSLNAVMTVLTD